jgi:hypothetical protein
MSLRTCCRNFSLICVLLALAILATPAFAVVNNCIQNEYNLSQGVSATGTTGSTKLNCTANDVSIAGINNITDLQGNPITTCFQGSTFSFIADFEIKTTSSQARENIGLYIATASTTQALTGTCDDNIITAQNSAQYHETDAPPDNCGDTSSNDSSPAFGAGTEDVRLEIDNFLCVAPAGSTNLVLPNCTSWQIPGGTIQCVSNDGSYPFNGPGGTPTAVPGTKSKCNCDIISLPITPVTITPTVAKACTTNLTSGLNTSCDAGPEGSTVTYTVTITNTSTVANNNVVVDQICDNRYGNVFTVAGFSGAACPAGTLGTATNVSCPPSPIAPNGGTGSCTFTAVQLENATVTDTVTASGHSSINTSSTFGPTSSNTVTVTSTDAPSTATTTKGVVGTEAACATVRYSVDVKNTSGFDEVLTLSALNDSHYGDITACTNANCANNSGANGGFQVLGTTCGQAGAGLGTLSGSAGAGALGTIAVGATYSCQFDGQFCSAVDANTCISETDTVSSTLAGDESEAVTATKNTLTVKECLIATVTSTGQQ